MVPISLFQLVVVFAGAGLSLAFLLRNLYPTISTADNASARLLAVAIGAVHLVFAIALWWGFLAGGTGAIKNDNTSSSPSIPDSGSPEGAALLL